MAEVIFSKRAQASLDAFDTYLREVNPKAAMAVLDEIAYCCGLIAEFPEMGREIHGTGLRYHVTRKYRYRVVYRLARDAVEVRDVMHPRRR